MAQQRKQRPQETPVGRGHGVKTEATRERAITALLTEPTLGKAARMAKVGERTLRRWLTSDDAFKADYAEARQAVFQAAMSRVQALTARVVEVLGELLDATDTPNVQLGAARTLVEVGLNRDDAETIMRRLAEIEAHQQRR